MAVLAFNTFVLKRLAVVVVCVIVFFVVPKPPFKRPEEPHHVRLSRHPGPLDIDPHESVEGKHLREMLALKDMDSSKALTEEHYKHLLEGVVLLPPEDEEWFDEFGNPMEAPAQVQEDPFAHQKSAKLPRSALSERQCDIIPAWFIYELGKAALTKLTKDPQIYHFRGGQLMTEQNPDATVGDEFCSVILAPQPVRDPFDPAFKNRPIEGWGPDSLHIELTSDDIRLIPQHPDYWGSIEVSNTGADPDPVKFAVYHVAYALNHPGTYQIAGEVEFQHYDWVMEDPVDLAQQDLPYKMVSNLLQPMSPAIQVTGTPASRPTQQCHRAGFADLHGRWYRADAFKSGGSQSSLNPGSELPFANHPATVDEWGWTFAPDACSLTLFSQADIGKCLEDRTLQFLGEGTSRRLLKALVAGGGWCMPSDASSTEGQCNCDDSPQSTLTDLSGNTIQLTPQFSDANARLTPITFNHEHGRGSKAYFDNVGGLLSPRWMNPWFMFYRENGDRDPNARSVTIKRLKDHGRIDVVDVSLITNDAVSVRTADEVLASLPDFRRTLVGAYPHGTHFLVSLANGAGAGYVNPRARVSGPRFAIFNHIWRSFFAEDERLGSMIVHDPSVLQGRREAEQAHAEGRCPTGNMRASHVRLEAQIWANAVCEGPGHGMRKGGFEERTVQKIKDEKALFDSQGRGL